MAGLLSDVRFGVRALITNPAFVMLAVTCLSIGIGASSMTFTVINDALIEPLGPVEPEGLVAIAEVHQSAPNAWWPASLDNFHDWEAATAESAQMSAYRESSFSLGPDESDARVGGALVAGDLFAVLGVAPILGRALQADDDVAGGQPVVVISETLWRQQFGSDPAIVGRALRIDGMPHTVVGVAPALLAVGMPRVIRAARIWVPLRADVRRLSRDDRSWSVIARLAAGVSVDGFAERLENIASELAAIHREDTGWSVRVGQLSGSAFSEARSLLLLSVGAAALLLLIACANVANLSLANATRRRHEFAIRTAIGASPARIARQLLCESLLVAFLGAALGLLFAQYGLDFLVRLYVADNLAPASMPIDTRSLAFAIALTFATTALFGLVPAMEAARGATRARIVESGTSTTTAPAHDRLRRGLVVGQVAASLVLLIGAALLAQSFMNLLSVDGGVETERVTSIRIEALNAPSAPAEVARYVGRVLDGLSAMPGVEEAAASSNMLPLRGGGFRSRVGVSGSAPDASAGPVIAYTGVTPGFFDALKIPILRGRSFGENEQRGRLAVVNESLAKLLWPDQSPVGRQFRLDADPERGWVTVIGVSRDFLTWDSNSDKPLPTAFMDAASFDAFPVFFFVLKRSTGQTITAESISNAIESLDFPLKHIVVSPMAQVARDPFWRQRIFSLWLAVFGVAALMLTAVGIYGVLAYLVWQRLREIGIRMALGADRHKVLLMVVRQGTKFVGVGIVIGFASSLLLARAMRGLLFGVEPLDFALFVGVSAFLALIAMAASVAPAVRAARIDPNALLRT